MNIYQYFRNRINSGQERSVKAKKNILQMLILKGGNIIIGLALVPLTLHYVNSETYGIWLTLSSMIAWISFFDIGINNGLKNQLAKALANKDYVLGKKLVSTTYAILSIIFFPIMVLLLIVAPMLNWHSILNIPSFEAEGLLAAICIIITYFCVQFVLSTINVVLMADQRPADASLRTFIQQLFSLVVIFVLTKTTDGSLVNLCLGLCFSPIIVVLIFNFTLFTGRYKKIAPSVKSIDFSLSPLLLKLGIQFFIIQIASIIQYQMINFLIIRYFGAQEVTEYNIAYKYFSVIAMIWGILTTPLWVAATDAIANNDYRWIKNTQIKYQKLLLLFIVGGIFMLLISKWVYLIWVGKAVSISWNLSLWVLIYNLVFMFGTIYVMIINGSGQLKIQTISSCISPLVFIGSFFLLYLNGVGVEAVLIAAIISNFNGLILAPMQCRYILKSHNVF